MPRQFEVFTGRFKPASSKALRVTLNKRGAFSLNYATYQALGEPSHVEMLYDRTDRVIGLRPVPEGTKHAYPVRKQGNAKSYLVGATAFCRTYELDDIDGVLEFFEPKVEDGVLILELVGALVVAPRPPRRSGNSTEKTDEKSMALPLS